MGEPAAPLLSDRSEGVTVSRRSLASFLRKMVRNPLEALPPEVFSESLVYSKLNGQARLYLCDPALIHHALVRHADCLSKGRISRRVLRPALGDGLLTAEGHDWRRQRQSISPAFAHAKLMGFLPVMIRAAEQARARWLTLGAGASVDPSHDMMLITFAIIVETMLSGPARIDVGRVERNVAAYLDGTGWSAVLAILGAPEWTPYPGRRRALAAAADLRGTVRAMVAERRAGAERDDLVSLLLAAVDPETGQGMSDEDVTDNLLTFITAGHETTAQGLGWTLFLLAGHPAVEAAVLDEIAAVTGGSALQPVHVAALTYTRQVFSEAMRLYPPAPIVTRRVERPFVLGGSTLPVGTVLVIPIFAVHRHARLWASPERFDPDRFAPDLVRQRPRFSYMPFGAGPRSCIGSAFALMEAVAILATLVPAIRMRVTGKEVPRPTMKITLRPVHPMRLAVEPRAGPR